MKENEERDKKFDPAPSGLPELDIFHWITQISVKDKNGKISWIKVFAAPLLIALMLPFVFVND